MEKTKVTFKREVFGLKEDRTLIDSPKNIKVMAETICGRDLRNDRYRT